MACPQRTPKLQRMGSGGRPDFLRPGYDNRPTRKLIDNLAHSLFLLGQVLYRRSLKLCVYAARKRHYNPLELTRTSSALSVASCHNLALMLRFSLTLSRTSLIP
jgi:hypothetical protein